MRKVPFSLFIELLKMETSWQNHISDCPEIGRKKGGNDIYRGVRGTFLGGDGSVHYLGSDNGSCVYICQKPSNDTTYICEVYCISIITP